MPLITYTDMVTSATTPFTDSGSLFKNPVAEGLSGVAATGYVATMFERSCSATPLPGDYTAPTLESGVTELVTQVDSYMTEKMKNISRDLLLAESYEHNLAKLSSIDAKVTGEEIYSTLTDPIKVAFTNEGGCPTADDLFRSITEMPSMLNNVSQTFVANLGMVSGITMIMNAVGAATGKIISDAATLMSVMEQATTQGDTGPIENAIRIVTQSYPYIISGLTTLINNTKTVIEDTLSAFNDIVADELASIKKITDQALGMQTINLFNSSSWCVQSVLNEVVRPEAVNPVVIDTLQSPSEYSLVKEEAVAVVLTNQPIPEDREPRIITVPPPPPPPDGGQQYTQAELNSMRALVDAKVTAKRDAQFVASQWWDANIGEWSRTVEYRKKRVECGWDAVTQTFGYGASTAQINEFKALDAEYDKKVTYYNTVIFPPVAAAVRTAEEYELEFTRRKRFGRNVYTNMDRAGAYSSDVSNTTYLDNSV